MRGDAAVTLRLLLRGTGLAGLAAMLGGLAAMVASALPWHELVATVEMLGASSSRTEARSAALPGWWGGWLCLAAGAAAVWLGAGIGFDRPVRWARPGLSVAAAAMALCALAALLLPPAAATIADPTQTLARVADRLPAGVDVALHVRASAGPWVTLVAAGLVAAGAIGSREG